MERGHEVIICQRGQERQKKGQQSGRRKEKRDFGAKLVMVAVSNQFKNVLKSISFLVGPPLSYNRFSH